MRRVNIHHIKEQMTVAFNHHVKEWKGDEFAVKSMLRWVEEEYQVKQVSLLGFMDRRMEEGSAYPKRTGFVDILTGKPPRR